MSLLGVHLTVLAGPTVPTPLPPDVAARVALGDGDRVRRRALGLHHHPRRRPLGADGRLRHARCSTTSPLRANARASSCCCTMGALPQVLMDGIVTETELTPGSASQHAELRVTGHDVSLLLDRHEVSDRARRPRRRPAGAGASRCPTSPAASSPRSSRRPCSTRRCRSSAPRPSRPPTTRTCRRSRPTTATSATSAPDRCRACSTLYWGPPVRVGLPQKALSVDLGPDTNVTGSPTLPRGRARARAGRGSGAGPRLGTVVPVRTVGSLRPPLAALPVWAVHQPDVRTRQFRDTGVTATTALGPRAGDDRPKRQLRHGAGQPRRRRLRRGAAAPRASSACAGPAGPTTGSGTSSRSSTTCARQLHGRLHAGPRGLRRHGPGREGLTCRSRSTS